MLVVIDDFSKYPEVEMLDMTTAGQVIPCLEKVMATHGLIQELRTENGLPFSSQEFAEYLAKHGVVQRKITPCWPEGNGEAERFMRTLNKVLRIAVAKAHNVDCALYAFLRYYRLTPQTTTKISPSALCMNRQVEDTIPQCEVSTAPQDQASERLCQHKAANDRVSRRRRARSVPLQVGDHLLVWNRHPGGKFRLPFEMMPWTVVRIRGTLVADQKVHESVTPNISFFKQYRSDTASTATDASPPPTVSDGLELGDNFLCTPELEITTPQGECLENNGGSQGVTSDECEGVRHPEESGLDGTGKTVVRVPLRAGDGRYHLRPRPLPSSKLRDFILT
ncbi:hypothetical protein NDU88_003390 [Pleurodeles waltl]|uniref:Integrase catalytic domain-containing protein n=1 Tax=Pleurodeles waltl TaxID=8319 RepID=A0AAV7Q8W5_PLEWA|nr:hypothetical protein NDU88_003390 [Pleurodeles waltl]